jgi:hypothetical protein
VWHLPVPPRSFPVFHTRTHRRHVSANPSTWPIPFCHPSGDPAGLERVSIMIKTTQAALMAILMAGAAIPAFAQTAAPAPATTAPTDQAAPAATPDQAKTDSTKPVTPKKHHRVHHRVASKTPAQSSTDKAPGQVKN